MSGFGPTWPEVESRELTRGERSAIKTLVTSMCANYCREYGCMPLECECYMLSKSWTGSYCRYFRESVLPNDPMLAASLTGRAVNTRPCAYCGTPFPINGRKVYCSDACAKRAQRGQQREHMRKKRDGC